MQPSKLCAIPFFLKEDFFLMWTTFQVFIELVTILLLFYAFLFFWPQAMEDLSSQIRDQTHNPSIGREVLTTGLPGKFPNSFLEEKQISLRNLTTESICPLVSCNLLFCSIAMYIQVHKKHMFYSSSLKHTYTHTHTHTCIHLYIPYSYPGTLGREDPLATHSSILAWEIP